MIGLPRGVYFLSATEMFERLSYYSVAVLLTLYMVHTKKCSTESAAMVFGTFAVFNYCFAVFAGYCADKFFGLKNSVIIGAALIAAGNFVLGALPGERAVYYGLTVIILGTGYLKSSVAAMVGQLFGRDDPRRSAGYTVFYIGINIGGVLVALVTAVIAEKYSYNAAFVCSSAMMLAGLFIFLAGRRFYSPLSVVAAIPGKKVLGMNSIVFAVVGTVLCSLLFLILFSNVTVTEYLVGVTALLLIVMTVRDAIAAGGNSGRQLLVMVFMILSLMVLFAFESQVNGGLAVVVEKMTDRSVCGLVIPAGSVITVSNSLTVVLLSVIFAMVWQKLDRCFNVQIIADWWKILIGFVFLLIAIIVLQRGVAGAAGGAKVELFWMGGAIATFALAEICIYPVVLSAVSYLAPAKDQGRYMGMFTAFIGIGIFVAAKLSTGIGNVENMTVVEMSGNVAKYLAGVFNYAVAAIVLAIGMFVITKILLGGKK